VKDTWAILVVGSVALDTVNAVRQVEDAGGAVSFSRSRRPPTTANMVAVVGEDFPRRYIDEFRARH
jgi:hypothetical protein